MTPSTTVLHSEPAFKIPIMIFGVLFLVFVLAVVILAVSTKKKQFCKILAHTIKYLKK